MCIAAATMGPSGAKIMLLLVLLAAGAAPPAAAAPAAVETAVVGAWPSAVALEEDGPMFQSYTCCD